jgi:hypothetical protein
MTEYELVDAAASYNGLLQGWLMAYFTILTAYLITAYAVGYSLNRFQTFVITTCFAVLNSLCVVAVMGTGMRFVELTQQATALNPERTYLVSPALMGITGAVLAAGLLVALRFMWDVRHPKTE